MSFLRRKIFFEPALAYFSECVWRPAVDVRRTSYGWLIKAELPGVALEQLEVSLRGNSVVLSGVRRDTLMAEAQTTYAMEIAYCRFERRVDLPVPIEGADLRLSTDDGFLILRLLVSPEAERSDTRQTVDDE